MMTYEDIKHKLPVNFVNKSNTIILINDKGEPVYKQNDDGSFSGFDFKDLGMDTAKWNDVLPDNRSLT